MRDHFATCPRCASGLDPRGSRFVCGPCDGVLVPEAEVQELLGQVRSRMDQSPIGALPFAPYTGSEPALTCPRCPARMDKHVLHGLTVDRCGEHGLWFDGTELAGVIAAAARLGAVEPGNKVKLVIAGTYAVGVVALEIIRFVYF